MKKELLDAFLRYLKFERGLSPATADSYSYAIHTYLVHLEGRGLEPTTATTNDMAAYLCMKSEHGLKAVSVFAIGMALRSFYGFLMLKGLSSSNPAQALELPRFRTRIPDTLSEEEVEKLFSFPAVRYVPARDKAILELLYCGLRLSEALNLQENQIRFAEGYARIHGKGGRTRLVPIGQKAREAILRYMEERGKRFPDGTERALFLTRRGRPLNRNSFWHRVKLYAKSAGLNKSVYPHLLRHCFASHMLQHGADLRSLQEMLGHRHLSTTAIYLHVSPQRIIEVYRNAHPHA